MSEATSRASLSANHILFREEVVALADAIIECDIFVSVASWEERGAAISQSGVVKSQKAIVFYFDPSHAPVDQIEESRRKMRGGLEQNGAEVIEVPLRRSTEFLQSLAIMTSTVENACRQIGSAKVCIDISSIPIGYIQGLTSLLLQKGVVAHLDCLYIEPLYGAILGHADAKFTSGAWRLAGVPYLEGEPTGYDERAIMVCVGAESDSTRELLLGRDYTEVSIVKPDSGISTNWTEQISRDCDELVSNLNVVGQSCKNANPFSVVDVAQYYRASVYSRWTNSQRLFVAIGTKPHGLAGVVCNLIDPKLSVFARIPGSYLVREAGAGSKLWKYSFRDLSSAVWSQASFADWS